MPTIITHGLVALALAAKTRFGAVNRKTLLLACTLCAMLPDIDYFGFKMHVPYNSLFGHRGFTHSFFFAALVAALLTWVFYRKTEANRAARGKTVLLLFAVTASHGILDAFTDGGEGVAFFSPFSNHRYFFPYRPIMVAPLGVGSFFNLRGLMVLVDEFLLVLVPVTLALYAAEAWAFIKSRKVLAAILAGSWVSGVLALQHLYPLNNLAMTFPPAGKPLVDLYVKQYSDYGLLEKIPVQGIPGAVLVTDFWDLQKRGLFNQRLETAKLNEHWASGFWGSWYGGVAGRWQDPTPALLLRTLVGYSVPEPQEILEVLKASATDPAKREFLYRLSPAEKYDLAIGDYGFQAARSVLAMTHNRDELPMYWYGICNGMATAAKYYVEPFRTVEVINPNGFRVRFHPNDVKALLGYGLAEASQWTKIGTWCAINGPEAEGCRINAGAFFLATMNRIGLARDGFVVDGFSGVRKQYYLFDAAKVEVLQSPKPVEQMPGWTVPTLVKSLAQVRMHLEFVSTLLSDKAGGVGELPEKGRGYYQKVGRIATERALDAMLALDGQNNVVGGAWLGEADVPDMIYFSSSVPATDKEGRLAMNPAMRWTLIRQIYDRSISIAKDPLPLDFSL